MNHAEIEFEQPEYEFLLAEARRLGTDVAALVRSYVAEHMPARLIDGEDGDGSDPFEGLIGVGSDPEFDGEDHDAVLYGPLVRR